MTGASSLLLFIYSFFCFYCLFLFPEVTEVRLSIIQSSHAEDVSADTQVRHLTHTCAVQRERRRALTQNAPVHLAARLFLRDNHFPDVAKLKNVQNSGKASGLRATDDASPRSSAGSRRAQTTAGLRLVNARLPSAAAGNTFQFIFFCSGRRTFLPSRINESSDWLRSQRTHSDWTTRMRLVFLSGGVGGGGGGVINPKSPCENTLAHSDTHSEECLFRSVGAIGLE